jgi:hypothetical protein
MDIATVLQCMMSAIFRSLPWLREAHNPICSSKGRWAQDAMQYLGFGTLLCRPFA